MRAAVLAVFLASCAEEPLYDGRFCTIEAPCPSGFSCVVGTCRRECAVNDECVVEGEVCVSGYCTGLTGSTDAGTVEKDSGVADASLPDAEEVECTDPSDCQSPGLCETALASCEQGRCVYPRIACLEPPPAECAGNDTLYQTFSSIGACNDATGQCEYTAMGVPCADCTATCLTPCASVSCDEDNGGCRTSGFCMPGPPGEPPQCLYDDADDGTECSTDEVPSGVCRGGECVECLEDADCYLDLCTTGACDTTDGTCSFAPIALDCSNAPECHQSPGACDPATGGCVFAPASGASCDDSNACTQTDTCSNGTCGGADPIACRTPPGQCYEITGTCEPSDGSCNYPPSANTRACDDLNACTHTDRCNGAGGCTGVAYSCNDSNACTSDACNGTGGCTNVRIAPSNLAPSGGAVVGTMDVTLTWGACAGGTYEIEIDWQRADLTWADYFTYTNEPTNSKTFYPCSNAAPGRPCNSDFRFRVRAHDGTAFGPWSAWAIWHWNNCRLC